MADRGGAAAHAVDAAAVAALSVYHALVLQIIVAVLTCPDSDELGHVYFDFCASVYSLYQNDPDQTFAMSIWDRRWFLLHPEFYCDEP